MRIALVVLSLLAAAAIHAADPLQEKYSACVTASTKDDGSIAGMIAACREPAEAGIPGAQYALGLGLLQRNEGNDRTAGLELLEKASASGNPAAMFALAGLLLQQESEASRERGRTLARQSLCEGYPLALQIMEQQKVPLDKFDCPKRAAENFDGQWIADLKWTKTDMPPAEDRWQMKLVIAGETASVFVKDDDDWPEVKPGTFKIAQREQTLILSSLDSGWDFDGKWIESWTVHLLRTGNDEAATKFFRTVNNPHLPATLKWRTFSVLAEGKSVRQGK